MSQNAKDAPVIITQFKWAGKLGPFYIKTTCGECDLTTSVLNNIMDNELKDKNVTFEIKPWLNNFFYCIIRKAWHAPIIMINGKKFYQYSKKEPLFDTKKLVESVTKILRE